MEKICYYPSPIGRLAIGVTDAGLRRICLAEADLPLLPGQSLAETPLSAAANVQLQSYFARELQQFRLPLAPRGTPFQLAVWQALLAIPYGETRSYGQIAAALGKPGAARAVGRANHENPLLIVVPCHRVIGADGSLVGYGGGLSRKEWLLRLEGIL